jgi:hypothetical protein
MTGSDLGGDGRDGKKLLTDSLLTFKLMTSQGADRRAMASRSLTKLIPLIASNISPANSEPDL